MKENELIKYMYSCLNLIINELNSIVVTELGDVDIVRKIIFMPLHNKYASIITILQYGGLELNDLDTCNG
jgi:hypothetical protein